MIDAGTVDDATMIRIARNWLSGLQIVNSYYFAAGYYLSTHLLLSRIQILLYQLVWNQVKKSIAY